MCDFATLFNVRVLGAESPGSFSPFLRRQRPSLLPPAPLLTQVARKQQCGQRDESKHDK
jgi:hypothetical protein